MVWAQSSTQRKLFQIKYDQIPAAILVSWNVKAAEAKETYQSPIPSRLAISFICRRVTLSIRSATYSNQIRHGMSWVISQDELDRNGDIMIPYQCLISHFFIAMEEPWHWSIEPENVLFTAALLKRRWMKGWVQRQGDAAQGTCTPRNLGQTRKRVCIQKYVFV